MLSFISRRLLQMAILLPLLSLLVFKVISMMPNPLEERMSANPKMKATDKKRLEKIYHFDKPPLFNWSIRDLPRNVTYHLAHLLPPQAPKVFEEETEYQKLRSSQNQNWGAEEQKRLKVLEKKKEQYETEMGAYRQARDQHEVALDHFKNWGKVTLPYLIEAEGKAQKRAEKDPQHQAFLEALRSLLQKISGKTEEQGPSGVMVWKDWYSTYQERLSPIRLKKTLLQLTKEDQQESAQQEIREIGTPYLEGLILKLQEEPALADEELQIVLDLLYDISTNLQESSDVLERQEAQRKKFKASDRERALYYWTEWWKNNGSDYKVLSSGTRFLRMFSHTQYGIWLGRILRSLAQGRFLSPDLGNSSTYKEPVAHLVSHKILNTLKLTLTAFFLSLVIALPLGIFAAIYQYSKQDYLINSFAFLGISMPSFWFGLMCSLLAMKTKWLPSSGMNSAEIADLGSWVDSARHLVLPAIVLAYYEIAILIRYMRTSMLEVKNQDFIRTARAKGLDEDMVIFKHALRNALIPVITVLAASMPFLFSGALITETIFSWDGVGNMLYEAVMQKDTNVVMPTFMLITFLTMLFTLVADVLYACVDPRIQYS